MTRFTVLAIALALGVAIAGIWRGTWAVGGSDSSCYALMAKAWGTGQLHVRSRLAAQTVWPNQQQTLAPGGFIPSPVAEDAAAPVCSPGFSLLLAPLYRVGGRDAIFVATPAAGAVLVWVTFLLGRRFGTDSVALASALVVATTPVVVFQLMQPMNDIAVAALWTIVVVLLTRPVIPPGWLGVVCGLAVLVRPNLAPLAVVVAAWVLTRGPRALLKWLAGITPAVVAVAALHRLLYGDPLRSGYGEVDDLFALEFIVPNLVNYGRAFWFTQLAFPLAGFAAVLYAPRQSRRAVWCVLSIVSVVAAIYLLYRPLPEWWYLRFFLPVIPALIVLSLASITWMTRRAWVSVAVALAVVAFMVQTHAMREAWTLWQSEGRFRVATQMAHDRLPASSVFVTVWNSGSVLYHSDRETVLWDSIPPSELGTVLEQLSAAGREPFIMIEDWEEPLFRQRFAATAAVGQLDWPPRFDVARRVRIYRVADRAAFYAGQHIPTEFVRVNRR